MLQSLFRKTNGSFEGRILENIESTVQKEVMLT